MLKYFFIIVVIFERKIVMQNEINNENVGFRAVEDLIGMEIDLYKLNLEKNNQIKFFRKITDENTINSFIYMANNCPKSVVLAVAYYFNNHEMKTFLKRELEIIDINKEIAKINELLSNNLDNIMKSADFYELIFKRIKKNNLKATGEEVMTYLNQSLYMTDKNKRNENAEVKRLIRLKRN